MGFEREERLILPQYPVRRKWGPVAARFRPYIQGMADLPAVVITGASTGIGAACALRLARHGFHVIAGVRKPEDGERLLHGTQGRLQWILLDVTDAETIARAADMVRSAQGWSIARESPSVVPSNTSPPSGCGTSSK